MSGRLRVVVADDERPARSYLVAMLATFESVETIGEAEDGAAAVELIERLRPDLALLDLQMPEVGGLSVVRLVKRSALPLVAFVTAYDDHAVQAFELNAVDYLLKPVTRARLAETLRRAEERLEQAERPAAPPDEAERLRAAAAAYEIATPRPPLESIPVRRAGGEVVLLPAHTVASVVADGELLHITTQICERYTINHRLKDLEARLDPRRFVRLSRGTLANREMIERVAPLPGGNLIVTLSNRQRLSVSRARARLLRDELLRI